MIENPKVLLLFALQALARFDQYRFLLAVLKRLLFQWELWLLAQKQVLLPGQESAVRLLPLVLRPVLPLMLLLFRLLRLLLQQPLLQQLLPFLLLLLHLQPFLLHGSR